MVGINQLLVGYSNDCSMTTLTRWSRMTSVFGPNRSGPTGIVPSVLLKEKITAEVLTAQIVISSLAC
jgi:hypothetical protein